jgi:hypothetical protein
MFSPLTSSPYKQKHEENIKKKKNKGPNKIKSSCNKQSLKKNKPSFNDAKKATGHPQKKRKATSSTSDSEDFSEPVLADSDDDDSDNAAKCFYCYDLYSDDKCSKRMGQVQHLPQLVP